MRVRAAANLMMMERGLTGSGSRSRATQQRTEWAATSAGAVAQAASHLPSKPQERAAGQGPGRLLLQQKQQQQKGQGQVRAQRRVGQALEPALRQAQAQVQRPCGCARRALRLCASVARQQRQHQDRRQRQQHKVRAQQEQQQQRKLVGRKVQPGTTLCATTRGPHEGSSALATRAGELAAAVLPCVLCCMLAPGSMSGMTAGFHLPGVHAKGSSHGCTLISCCLRAHCPVLLPSLPHTGLLRGAATRHHGPACAVSTATSYAAASRHLQWRARWVM
jgi:hypothetical protein